MPRLEAAAAASCRRSAREASLLRFYLAVLSAEDMGTVGTFTTIGELLDVMRRRQEQLRLSNAGLEEVCGLTAGAVNKYLGPAREKCPTGPILQPLLDGLALSGSLHVDSAKEARYRGQIEAAGRRVERAVHPNSRVSRKLIERVRPYILAELAGEVYEPQRERRGRPRKSQTRHAA